MGMNAHNNSADIVEPKTHPHMLFTTSQVVELEHNTQWIKLIKCGLNWFYETGNADSSSSLIPRAQAAGKFHVFCETEIDNGYTYIAVS